MTMAMRDVVIVQMSSLLPAIPFRRKEIAGANLEIRRGRDDQRRVVNPLFGVRVK